MSFVRRVPSPTLAVPTVFLVVNPSSGGYRASEFTKLGLDFCSFHDRTLSTDLYIFDITEGESGKKKGFEHLKDVLESSPQVSALDPIRLVVAGGDGTVIWAMHELEVHGVDCGKVAVGVVPFGTGNDFSRTLGWGAGAPSNIIGMSLG